MYQKLDTLTLRNGEAVEAGVVIGPDPDWAERIKSLLSHKGPRWQWQNAQMIERDLPLDARFYILHRNGTPFGHIMTGTVQGVGLLGHVWTVPADRQQGASSALLTLVLEHFHGNGGQALILGTGSIVAERMYARQGFRRITPDGAHCLMAYYTDEPAMFQSRFFGESEPVSSAVIEPLGWQHWPTSSFLLAGTFPGVVRNVGLGLFGQDLTEGPFLELLRQVERGIAQQTLLLSQAGTGAPVGCATWRPHPVWSRTALVDLYCHPRYWARGADLLQGLTLPGGRAVAHTDPALPEQGEAFGAAGFERLHTLPQWLSVSSTEGSQADIDVWIRA